MAVSSTWKRTLLRWSLFAGLLYLFFLSITLMGDAFKGMGRDQVTDILSRATHNPFTGLLIGILTTAIIQSSSTTTSMVVGFVSGGVLGLRNAIPIIMGANIGTTITNALVSLGHARQKAEFQRAFSVAIVHDVFNVITVIILFPMELSTHYLERSALFISDFLVGGSGVSFHSPLTFILKPVASALSDIMTSWFGLMTGSIVLLVLALAILITALVLIVKIMKSLVGQKIEASFDGLLSKYGVLGIFIGMGITAIIQSSSLTTSLLVPMAGAGIITIEAAFPVTLGANIGTTVTALLASMAGNPTGLAVALCHLLFNLTGTLIIYPLKPIRRIPVWIAIKLGAKLSQKWYYAVAFIITLFFILPLTGMVLFG